jgi:DNA-binding transcriptional MerR regulator
MRPGLSIGDFSQITHLSVKTLRRYHEAGLLPPAEVDPDTGYRYYALTQVPTAQVIRRFRELGMPVREVAEVLSASDPQARSALIAGHLVRLESQLDETRAAVTALRRLL